MKKLSKNRRSTAGMKRVGPRVRDFYCAFRTSKGPSSAGGTVLNRLSPKLRSLVKEIVARYDEDLRRLARH